jgi:uncharacterized protein
VIGVTKEVINGKPLLHVANQQHWTECLPTIFFIHGFTSAKEHNLHYAYLLAEEGFRVFLPDCLYHGERSAGFTEQELNFQFWNIVIQTIHELKEWKDVYVHKGFIDEERIGVAGTSMGGIVTLGALTQYDWIQAAVSLMGTPTYEQFAKMQMDYLKQKGIELPLTKEEEEAFWDQIRKFDFSQQPEKWNKRPLMFWHGEKDDVVPYEPAFSFYEQLKAMGSSESLLKFICDPSAGHKVTREGVLQTVAWFQTHLLSTSVKVD